MKNRPGQTLVLLLVFIAVAITITTAAVTIIIVNSQAATRLESSLVAYNVAESGAENALITLLRNRSYIGETLTIGDGVATITVTGSNPKTILSSGTSGNYIRQVQVVAVFTQGVLSITSWQEVF